MHAYDIRVKSQFKSAVWKTHNYYNNNNKFRMMFMKYEMSKNHPKTLLQLRHHAHKICVVKLENMSDIFLLTFDEKPLKEWFYYIRIKFYS